MSSTGVGQDIPQIDLNNLYREEQYSDLKVGSLRTLLPVTAEGQPDPARKPLWFGQTHVMTRAGPVPVDFEIEAANLAEAARKFPEAVQKAVDDMVAEAQKLQRERASSLIVPGGPLPPGMGGPGMPGGGKIQFP